MFRTLDIVFSLIGLVVGFPVFLVLYVLGLFDTGAPLFVQERVGLNLEPFNVVKFRTMSVKTPQVATHLADANSVTRYGRFLRKTKLDELPQLWNVLVGDMSMVGPRPNLFNQGELITHRVREGVYKIRPGITGLAQLNDIDMSMPELLAQTDAKMISELTLVKYFGYIIATVVGKGGGDRLNGQNRD